MGVTSQLMENPRWQKYKAYCDEVGEGRIDAFVWRNSGRIYAFATDDHPVYLIAASYENARTAMQMKGFSPEDYYMSKLGQNLEVIPDPWDKKG